MLRNWSKSFVLFFVFFPRECETCLRVRGKEVINRVKVITELCSILPGQNYTPWTCFMSSHVVLVENEHLNVDHVIF